MRNTFGYKVSTKIPEGVQFITVAPSLGLIQYWYGPPETVLPQDEHGRPIPIGSFYTPADGHCAVIPTPKGSEIQQRAIEEEAR